MARIKREQDVSSAIEKGAVGRLRIGAVSRITQIPVDTLRAWERRYNVVAPQRSGAAARLYSEHDVARLKLIRRLVDDGHAIGSVARLKQDELEGLLGLHHSTDVGELRGDTLGVMLYRESEPSLAQAFAVDRADLEVLGEHRTWSEFEAAVLSRDPDALVIDCGALVRERGEAILRLLRRALRTRALVVYRFAPSRVLAALAAAGVVALPGPVASDQIARELQRAPPAAGPLPTVPETAPPRRFDDRMLAELAMMPTSVQCECPHQLVQIIGMLTEFERYSAECENHDDGDAALHARLGVTTAAARAMFEQALIEVAAHEGIALPGISAPRTQNSRSTAE